MSSPLHATIRLSLAALISLAATPGCSDRLLPADTDTQRGPAKIVFSEITGGSSGQLAGDLFRIEADGSGLTRLTDGMIHASPGRAGVAIVRNYYDVWFTTIDGAGTATPRLIATGRDGASGPATIDPATVATSPDGTRVTYSSFSVNDRVTVIAGVDGSVPITLPLGAGSRTTPGFSRDGLRMAFVAADQPGRGFGPGAVYVVNVDGTGLFRVASVEEVSARLPGLLTIEWSPSGDRLVYACQTPTGHEVRVVGVDGSGGRTIGPGSFPVWNHTGDSVLFTPQLPTESDIYLFAADGSGTPRRITNTPSQCEFYTCCSPDGSKLLFTSCGGQSTAELTLYDLATGTSTILAEMVHKGFWVE